MTLSVFRDEFELFKQNVADSKPLHRSRTASAGSGGGGGSREAKGRLSMDLEQELEDEEMMNKYASR